MNTRDTAGIVMALIAKAYNWQVRWGAFMNATIETDVLDLYTPGAEQRYPWLDQELRERIGRMMAKDEQHRWPLSLCLQKAQNAVRTRTAADYGIDWREETDQAIMEFIQQAFHDPSTAAAGSASADVREWRRRLGYGFVVHYGLVQ